MYDSQNHVVKQQDMTFNDSRDDKETGGHNSVQFNQDIADDEAKTIFSKTVPNLSNTATTPSNMKSSTYNPKPDMQLSKKHQELIYLSSPYRKPKAQSKSSMKTIVQ